MKFIFNICLLAAVLVLASCNKKDEYNLNIPYSGIALSAPAENGAWDLNDETGDFTFTWNKLEGDTEYTLILSKDPLLLSSVKIKVGNVSTYTMDALDLNGQLAPLGIGAGKAGTIYWTVKETSKLEVAATEIRALAVNRVKTVLRTPEDQQAVVLQRDNENEQVSFAWDMSEEDASDSYELVLKSDLSAQQSVSIPITVTDGVAAVTHRQLQNAIVQFPIRRFTSNQIYWNVKDVTKGKNVSLVYNILNLSDMLEFTDVRGDEAITYKVTKVTYSDGEEVVWLAENLRATRFPDGTALALNTDYKEAPANVPENYRKAYGNYYSIRKRADYVPAGWRLPKFEEVETLLRESYLSEYQSYNILLSNDYWYWPSSYRPENVDAWGLGFVMAGIDRWGNGVESYNCDGNCALLVSDRDDKFANLTIWGLNNDRQIYSSDCSGFASIRLIYVGNN